MVLSFLDATKFDKVNEKDFLFLMKMFDLEAGYPNSVTEKDMEPFKGVMPMAMIMFYRLGKAQITLPALLFVGSLAKLPGQAVLWAYTLHKLFQKTNKIITVMGFVEVFPDGFPTEEEYLRLWNAQKNAGANLLDIKETWEN